ncbi:hypothetical protein ACRWG2_22675, partial [Escherichia coli]
VTLKMPAFEWVHVQLHQQKGMISLSPPTICNSAILSNRFENTKNRKCWYLSVLRDFQGKVRRDQLAGSLQDRLAQDLQ